MSLLRKAILPHDETVRKNRALEIEGCGTHVRVRPEN